MNLKSHPAVGLWAWWAAGLLICFHGDALLSDSVETAWQGEMKNEATSGWGLGTGVLESGQGYARPLCRSLCCVDVFGPL